MTADKLRDSILLSAVKGTLVPQYATDTPASLLIKEIEREKAAMISERRIKKPIKTDPFTEEDDLFDIPEGWQWCRLGDLLSVVSDGTHQTPKYVDSGIPFLSVQNISSGQLDLSKAKYISEEEHIILTDRIRPQYGDILICRIGTLGKALEVTWRFDFSIFVSLGIIRPIDNRLTPYILTAINSPWGKQWIDKVKVGGGTHTNKINLSDVPSFPIPVPPIEEQKRIIAKIIELFPLVDEYDKAAIELNTLNDLLPDKLRKSILQDAIHGNLVPNGIPDGEATAPELLQQILKERQDRENIAKGKKAKKLTLSIIEDEPWDLPEGWCWCKLRDIGECETGTTPSKAHPEYFGGATPFLSPGNIQNNTIVGETIGISEKGLDFCRLVEANTIVQVCIGGSIGKCAIVQEKSAFNQQINSISTFLCDFKYVYYVLQTDYFYLKMKDKSTGTATPIINRGNWEQILFPLPPLSIQHRIVEKIEDVFAAIDKLQS